MRQKQPLIVVMYHYVRDFETTIYPKIKGLDVRSFETQLEMLKNNFNLIDFETLVASVYSGEVLPPRACLLTFDDGYSDHYSFALPLLEKFKIKAMFFPPVNAIEKREILEVNQIHYILASEAEPTFIFHQIEQTCLSLEMSTKKFEEIVGSIDKRSRFDTKEVILIKRLLQHALPIHLRKSCLDKLFRQFVSNDPSGFADELYMNKNNLLELISAGHTVGSHTTSHPWLNEISKSQQIKEIDKSIEFLKEFNMHRQWSIAYPYGGYNTETIEILKERGASLAFTTIPVVCDDVVAKPLAISRLDTNDFLEPPYPMSYQDTEIS